MLGLLSYVLLAVGLYLLYEWVMRRQWIGGIPGKYIFITGCDTGFGHALAKHLDLLGCKVFAGCLTEDGCKQLMEKCSDRLTTLQLDVTDTDDVKKAAEFVKARIPPHEGLWGLVNNAGIAGTILGPFEWYTKRDFQKVLDVNLLGVVDVTLAFLPLLTKSKGRIVNISSINGRISTGGNAAYSVSKHGVEVLSDSLRQELSLEGIKVSILEPSAFSTPLIGQSNMERLVQAGWDRLPQEKKDQYDSNCVGTYIKTIMTLVESGASTDINEVIGAYTHALLATYPKKRYSVGPCSRYMHIPLSYMPSWVHDVCVLATMGKLFQKQKAKKSE